MAYPFWDAGLAYGPLMAAIGVVHVFISHFAIGGGLYLVAAEWRARKAGDDAALEFLRQLSRFFVLVTLVGGALTGVGIWFVIGLLNPAATEYLIRNFVWVWAIEWTFFVVEITSALVYYYGWQGLSPRRHMAVGWLYFAAAWASLFAINGIITFMLTAGDWKPGESLAKAFFNPTFWPSLVARTAFCLVLAGLYVLTVLAARAPAELRARWGRGSAIVGLVSLVAAAGGIAWYLKAVPEAVRQAASVQMHIPAVASNVLVVSVAATAAVLALLAAFPRLVHWAAAALVMAGGFLSFGAAEWMREAARKPWAVPGAVYANGVGVAEVEPAREKGMKSMLAFRSKDDGADAYRRACASCHTIDGYRPLTPAMGGMDAEFIAGIALGTDAITNAMPPFAGTADDAEALAEYLVPRLGGGDPYSGIDDDALPRAVYARRCGLCHVPGGRRDVAETFSGMEAEEVGEFLEGAGDVDERMPAFTGTDRERAALVKYLLELGRRASKGGEA